MGKHDEKGEVRIPWTGDDAKAAVAAPGETPKVEELPALAIEAEADEREHDRPAGEAPDEGEAGAEGGWALPRMTAKRPPAPTEG